MNSAAAVTGGKTAVPSGHCSLAHKGEETLIGCFSPFTHTWMSTCYIGNICKYVKINNWQL